MRLAERLEEAIKLGDTDQVSKLISESSPNDIRHALSARSDDEWSLLMKAAKDGHAEIVDLLLDANASINEDVGGITALLATCMLAPPETAYDIAVSLLNAKANPNAVDRFRETPIMKAAARGLVDVIHALVKEGAEVNARDNNEHTALYHAANGGHVVAIMCLLQYGADEQAQADALAVAEVKELAHIVEVLAPGSEEPEEEVPVALPERYKFAKVLAELPTGEGRVGFPSDVSLLLSGVGLGHYTNALLAAGFGAAQVVTADDKVLRDAGVRFAAQRRMIMNGMVRLAMHGWSTSSLPDVTTITNALHAACTAVRQIHFMWATTILGRIRGDPDLEKEPDLEKRMSIQTIVVTKTVIRDAEEIRRRALNIAKLAERKMYAEPVAPADLIRPFV